MRRGSDGSVGHNSKAERREIALRLLTGYVQADALLLQQRRHHHSVMKDPPGLPDPKKYVSRAAQVADAFIKFFDSEG